MDPTKSWACVDFYYADIQLPETSGIYCVFADRAGRDICVYVGQSKNLKQRWQNHNKTLACLREGAEFIRFQCVQEQDLDEQEIHYIKHYEPSLNSKHLGATSS